MSVRTSVVLPVKDGERYLEEVLDAILRQQPDEVLVVDSGSQDRSLAIARAAGVRIVEIEPASFGHGRTRNLAAELTSGELICFLTQDATPVPGWLDAYRAAFALDPRVGAAYGPHLPRPATSPMIARELTEFFATFSASAAASGDAGRGDAGGGPGADSEPVVQNGSGPSFLSNANAAYRRQCWAEIRFRDVAYSEDQAFGQDMLAAGWLKVYQPAAAVLHAHDYGWTEFMRRYFDEYRGLRESIGHVEPFGIKRTTGHLRRSVAADRRWLSENAPQQPRLRWTLHSAAHHGGRSVAAALGSRAGRLPGPLQALLSLERRAGATQPSPGSEPGAPLGDTGQIPTDGVPALTGTSDPAAPALEHVEATPYPLAYSAAAEVWRDGVAPLRPAPPGLAERERLRLAMVLPPFSRGSGGHMILFQILKRLEDRGHVCSVWMEDFVGMLGNRYPSVIRHDIVEYFAPIKSPVYRGFDDWHGADIVIATGWQTVHPILQLEDCHARAYIVNDHEPEFYGTSTERILAEDTYRHGLHCIAASPWLSELLQERYGAPSDSFRFGVDHDVYRPRPVARRPDTVIYYARPETGRRAVPIGMLALAELMRRRPQTRVVLFGSRDVHDAPFPYDHLGILTPDQLAALYSEATVGLCLSLTNYSLMPQEMMACGLPCVDISGVSSESVFGADGPIELAQLDPVSLADAIERLLDDRPRWEGRSEAGIEYARRHTWDAATDEVERGLRNALRAREP